MDEELSPELIQARKLNDAAMALAESSFKNYSLAISMLKRAVDLRPDLAEPVGNLGLLLFREGFYEIGLEWICQACDMDEQNASYFANAGVCFSVLGKHSLAISFLEKALNKTENKAGVYWDLALTLLKKGDWAQGLELYEIRKEHRGPELYPLFPVPEWKGEDLNNKTLYIQGEQGIGDRILFSRYIKLIQDKYPQVKILMCVTEKLSNLFWSFTDKNIEILPNGIPWPKDIDFACYLCSLPKIFKTTQSTIPSDSGWFISRLNKEQTRCCLPEPDLKSLKIGICFTGNPSMLKNKERSVSLDYFIKIAENPKIQLYNFQCGEGHNEFKDKNAEALIVDLAPSIEKEGLVGTALALKEMDLIITVCTSVAHLAGALNLNCWVLLSSDPYWIWGTAGDKTAWYPSIKLFRQKSLGDWGGVFDKVEDELNSLLIEKGI